MSVIQTIKFVAEGLDKVTEGIEQATEAQEEFNDEVEESGKIQGNVFGTMDKAFGGVTGKIKGAVKGVKNFIKGLKLTRGAIAATGIGALVIAATALVGMFFKTERGANALKKIMAGLGAVVEQVTARFKAIGGFIFDLFSSGPTEAVKNYKKEIDGLPGSFSEAISKAIELEQRTQDLEKAQRKLTVTRAKERMEIKRLNKIAEDTTKSFEEREKAAKEALEKELALMAETVAAAEEEYAIAKERSEQSQSSAEELNELAELEAAMLNARTESYELQTTLQNKLNTIRQAAHAEEMAREKEAEDKRKARRAKRKAEAAERAKLEEEVTKALVAAQISRESARKQDEHRIQMHYDELVKKAGKNSELIAQIEADRLIAKQESQKKFDALELADEQKKLEQQETKLQTLEAFFMTEEDAEIAATVAKYEKLFAISDELGIKEQELQEKQKEELKKINDKYRKQETDAEDAKAKKDLARRKATADMALGIANAFLTLMTATMRDGDKEDEDRQRKQFKKQKSLQAAGVLINTAAAIAAAFSPPPVGAGPVGGIPLAVKAGIEGAAQLITINKQTFPGGGGSESVSDSVNIPSLNVAEEPDTQIATVPQFTGTLAGAAPVQAYVVSQNVTTQQQLDAELAANTTL